jgi:membrane fusion protein, multidrug efflux system
MKADVDAKGRRRARRRYFLFAAVAGVLLLAGAALLLRPPAKPNVAQSPPVPVTVVGAARLDVPILREGLGTVQAANTISIRTQIDGPLQSVNFVEGQLVHKGDTLAVIDPRPLQAALTQAVGKKAQDQAQLVNAQKNLTRAQSLVQKGFETPQTVDQQQANVGIYQAAIQADEGAIQAAQTQLSYTTIVAPIDGRVGFRQVDAGNIVHAADQNPLTVLTQIRPALVQFTLPQTNLGDVREAMLRGAVPVTAFDQDNNRQLAQGSLLLIDNQIDQTTSTIRLKATFPNEDERLWPGEFVHARVAVDVRKGAITIPAPALQRGPQGFYAWVIKPDDTAEQRAIEASPASGDVAIVTKGIAAGDRVVVDGQYRLQPGAHVDAKTQTASAGNGAS